MYSGEDCVLLQNIPNQEKRIQPGTLRLKGHEWEELYLLGSTIRDFFYAVEHYHQSDTMILELFGDTGDIQKNKNGGYSCTYPIIENNLFIIFHWNSDDHTAFAIIKRVVGNANDKMYLTAKNAHYLFGGLEEKVGYALQMWDEMHETAKLYIDSLLSTDETGEK